MNYGPWSDARPEESVGFSLGSEDLGHRPAIPLSDSNDNLFLAVLVFDLTAIYPVIFQIRRFDVAAEIGSIYLCHGSVAADLEHLNLRGDCLPEFVGEDVGCLVLHVQGPGEGQRGLALNLVGEHDDRGEVCSQGQLVSGKDRSGCYRQTVAASLAPLARRTIRAATIIDGDAAATGAVGFAVVVGKSNFLEHFLDFGIRHLPDPRFAQGPGSFGKEEMLTDVTTFQNRLSYMITGSSSDLLSNMLSSCRNG